MSLEASKLYQYASRVLGTSGMDFEEAVISAINDVSRDLRSKTKLTVSVSGDSSTNVEQKSETIDLDDQYLSVYKRGIIYYVGISGEWGREPDQYAFMNYRRAMGEAQRLAREDEDPDVGFVR